jgi:Selenocysteine lyase
LGRFFPAVNRTHEAGRNLRGIERTRTINNVRRAGEMAHSSGAKIFVDAVHHAPHELIDVRDWNCDFLACSAYKFYGPHIGILYGRHDLLDSLDFPKLAPAPDSAPERAETGTQNHEGIAGAAAAVNFLASLASGSTLRERLHAAFRNYTSAVRH